MSVFYMAVNWIFLGLDCFLDKTTYLGIWKVEMDILRNAGDLTINPKTSYIS